MELGGSSVITMLREEDRLPPFPELQYPRIFGNLQEAYESFDTLLNRTLRVRRTLEMVLADPLEFPNQEALLLEIEAERIRCLQYLDDWWRAFHQHLTIERHQYDKSSNHSVSVLRIWRAAAKIFLSVKHTDAEEMFDQFQGDFDTIVTLSEAVIEASSVTDTSSRTPSFSFYLGILSPIFLTIIRCRHPIIRRRALDIISSSRRCEGIWDSHLACTVAKQVIDAEAQDTCRSTLRSGTDDDSSFFEPDTRVEARVKTVSVEYDDCAARIELELAE